MNAADNNPIKLISLFLGFASTTSILRVHNVMKVSIRVQEIP